VGVVSAEVAESMASGAKRELHTAWGVSFTGVAGPDALEGHPAGTVFIGIAAPDGTVAATKFGFNGDRQHVRDQSVATAFDLLADKIKQIEN